MVQSGNEASILAMCLLQHLDWKPCLRYNHAVDNSVYIQACLESGSEANNIPDSGYN